VSEIVQPAMRPVFNTKQVGDVILSVSRQLGLTGIGGGASTYYDYLRERWAGISGGGEAWRAALQRGGVFDEDPSGANATALFFGIGGAAGAAQAAATTAATTPQDVAAGQVGLS